MSTPTPQEIRDRLALIENIIRDATAELGRSGKVSTLNVVMLADAKTNVLHVAALTLLVDQQTIANRLAAAQILATTNSGYNTRDAILIAQEILGERDV